LHELVARTHNHSEINLESLALLEHRQALGNNTLPRWPAGCSLAAVALLQLGGAGAGFRDSQQTRWGAQRETMAGAEAERKSGAELCAAAQRTAPLFFKAAVPNPVRVVPSFFGEGRWRRPARACALYATDYHRRTPSSRGTVARSSLSANRKRRVCGSFWSVRAIGGGLLRHVSPFLLACAALPACWHRPGRLRILFAPPGERVTPDSVGVACRCNRSGPEVWKLSARRHGSDEVDEVREAIAAGAPTAPLAELSAQLVCPAANPRGADLTSVAAHKAPGDAGAVTVAAVDAAGGIVVSVSQAPDGSAGNAWDTHRVQGEGFRDGESGWGGVELSGDGRQLAVVRQWQRSLAIYDVATGGLVRSLHTSFGPNSVSWLGAGGAGLLPDAEGLVAVAEHKCISLWDLRVGSTAPRAACVQRLVPTATSPIYSVNWVRGVIGIRGRAMGVTKTQAMSLSFSAADPRIYFVHGADTQLVCGQWDDAGGPSLVDTTEGHKASMVPVSVSTGGHKGTHIVTGGSLRKVFEFRSVGRWVATHKLRHADSFFGVCNEQALYMLPPSDLAHLLTYTNKRKREEEDHDDD